MNPIGWPHLRMFLNKNHRRADDTYLILQIEITEICFDSI